MAQTENHPCPVCGRSKRDGERAYSAFHRVESAQRWIGRQAAETLANINIDSSLWIECDHETYEPIALVETAVDVGQSMKTTTAIWKLARRCTPTVKAFLVLYKLADETDEVTKERRVLSFGVQQLWPTRSEITGPYGPLSFLQFLMRLRQKEMDNIANTRGRSTA